MEFDAIVADITSNHSHILMITSHACIFTYDNMADYSKLKVNELKEELKARGISFAGLKLKQNFIDKLLKADAVGQTNALGALVVPVGGAENHEVDEQDLSTNAQDVQSRDEPAQNADATPSQPVTHDSIVKNESAVYPESGKDENEVTPEEAKAKLQSAAVNAPEDGTKEPILRDGTIAAPALGEPRPAAPEVGKPGPTSAPAGDGPGSQTAPVETLETLPPSSAASTPHVPVQEMIEDSRKRKRRSVTPPPSAADVAQKKAKASDGSPLITRSVDTMVEDEEGVAPDLAVEGIVMEAKSEPSALERMQEATDTPEIVREGDGVPEGEQSASVHATSTVSPEGNRTEEPMAEPLPKPLQSPEKQSIQNGPGTSLFAGLKKKDPSLPLISPPSKSRGLGIVSNQSTLLDLDSEERAIAPALHPATSSLYMRNFKRPLHLSTFRAHLAKIARGPTLSSGNDEDPIVSYFLDSIRTHALVSFKSISAASRVRSALHDTRYPDEKTRDPLWIDFIPDDKVQSWIDIETKSAGHGTAQRWEVVYEDGAGGVEAVLQEVGAGGGPRRPSTVLQRQSSMSGVQRQPSMSDVQRPSPIAGVHPDRLPLVPQNRTDARNELREEPRRVSQPEISGTGFQALDELFSFTTAKPKLYYKPVSQKVADRRMDAIKDLRVGHADMGKSGDEDMKRYSFEMYRGQEEWVDKGPEFGYGRRGVERMRGGAPTRGAYRGGGSGGRGGFRDRDRDDAWRGPRR